MWIIVNNIYDQDSKSWKRGYYTGQTVFGNGTLTGWNIYKKYAFVFDTKEKALFMCGKLKKLLGSEKCKVKIFNEFSKS